MNGAAWRNLAPGLVASALMLIAGTLLLFFASRNLHNAQTENRQARLAAQSSKEKLMRLQRDEPEIRKTLTRLDEILKSGLVGPEQRLDWADHMRNIAKQLRIADLGFEIAPQRTLGKLDERGDYMIKASTMRFSADLLHEGDLLRILQALRKPVPGQSLPLNCALERNTTNPSNSSNSASVRAQCDVDWLSIAAPIAPTAGQVQ